MLYDPETSSRCNGFKNSPPLGCHIWLVSTDLRVLGRASSSFVCYTKCYFQPCALLVSSLPSNSNHTGTWRSLVLKTVVHLSWMSIVTIMMGYGCFSNTWSWAGSCTGKAANVLESKKWRPFASRRVSHSVLQTSCFVWYIITWYKSLETVVLQRRFKGE